MSGVKDSFLDLERHRAQLEDNIKGLKKALNHWRTWDIEYEALKEEVEAVPAGTDASQATELRRIQDAFEGELLDKDEVLEIFGQQRLKSTSQIKNILDRRIDYVTKNIETLSKQLESVENKFAAATVISQPDATDDDGQPITDIVEELDEDDNVLSYRLMQPGNSLPQVREALEKAGVQDLANQEANHPQETTGSRPSNNSQDDAVLSENRPQPISSITPPSKKEVTFAEDTKTGPESPPSPQVSRAAKRVARIMEDAKAQENWASEAPVVPDDEDPEDAALRQEMLKYSMGEVGAVVAELQLEELGSDDEEMEDFGYSDEEEDGDDEDQYGRSRSSVLTDDYRTRMLELQKKLGIKSSFPADPAEADEDDDSSVDNEGIGRIVVKHEPEDLSSTSKSTSSSPAPLKSALKSANPEKKGVRFSQSLDIAPTEESSRLEKSGDKAKVDPVSEVVIERSGHSKPPEAAPPRKPSRFKRSRDEPLGTNGVPRGPFDVKMPIPDEPLVEPPTGPEGQTIADKLVERDTTSKPVRFDDVDDSMIHAEVADEHQRLRKKFIQREGGFLKEDESPIQPLDESEGGRERMSRFKAARLSKQ